MTLLVLVASSILGYTLVYRQFSMMETQFNDTGSALAAQLGASSVEPVFTEDALGLSSLVNSLNEQEVVASVAVFNRQGNVLAEAGTYRPFLDTGNEITVTGRRLGKDDITWFYAPIVFRNVNGGTAWVGLDKSGLAASQAAVVRSGILVVLLLVVAITAVAVRLGRSLGKPVNDLIEGTQAIESGRYDFRIERQYSGEFKALTESFNTMARGLEQKDRVERLFSRFVSNPVAAHYMARDEAEPTQEGRLVEASVIFVDLVGYTAFSEGRNPADVADILNQYFTEFADICHRYQGNVDKYIGDCAMLVFGCPQTDPEHRYHAMQCAIGIRERIIEMNQERAARNEPCLNIRIGLSGGELLAGLLGSHERLQYTVVGEPANLASRLCDRAEHGQVLTDKAFFDALNESHPLGSQSTVSIQVKGFQAKVDALTVTDFHTATAEN
ncbi:adenylate/guanylate cyclase domain-containing protein [Saccharospirillum mangrovi]|nr:adenylate/guanylate cyclase domain-containing protein [Saccharospirillum mangrovi]